MVVDALAFELPKAVVRFAGVSDECRGIVDSVVDHFVAVCNPRDMHSVLCEVSFIGVRITLVDAMLVMKLG